MTHCALCELPLGKAGNGTKRPRIVCAPCHAKSDSETKRAEDRYWRSVRLMFEEPARVWAAHTMRREA